jgi:hypothetical protein
MLVAPDREVPAWFDAEIKLADFPLTVTITVVIGLGYEAFAKRVELVAADGSAVTTSGIRKVLVDQLVKAAVAEASTPVQRRDELVVSGEGAAWETAGPGPLGEPGPIFRMTVQPFPATTRQQRLDERARQAAKIYAAAVNSGSRAPGDAVATEMGYSRSQAARYIRRARELGILPTADVKDGEQ